MIEGGAGGASIDFVDDADVVPLEEEEAEKVWDGVCLDDGTGRDVYYVSRDGTRSRRKPPGYVVELLANGDRRYYYRKTCIRCRRNNVAPIFLTFGPGEVAYSLNICDDCHIRTTPGTTRLRGNGEAMLRCNAETPKNAWIDLRALALSETRDEDLLVRAEEARLSTRLQGKYYRNKERSNLMKQTAAMYGIQLGTHLSWGFETTFDEYFGDVDENNEPSGQGVKIYSDGSVYFGGWLHGEHHTETRGQFTRPNNAQYDGTWMGGLKHGKGTQIYPDGSSYTGEFAKGYEHGYGVKNYPNGSVFEGRFRFGRKDGPGSFTDANGNVEKGNFLDPSEKYNEKPPPYIVEKEKRNESYHNPPSLLSLSIKALAKAMHTNREKCAPAGKIQRRVPEHLKKFLAEEFLRIMKPEGSASFIRVGPSFAFNLRDDVIFQDVKITKPDAEAIMYFQSSNVKLKTLKCTSNALELESIDLITRNLIGRAWPILHTLDLSFNSFDVSALQSMMRGVVDLESLRSLRLAACTIKPSGVFVIATMLSANRYLESLDLAFNSVETMGAEALADALKENESLLSLNLRSNNISVIGAQELADCLKINKKLRVMCLTDNGIGPNIMAAVSSRLKGGIGEVARSVCMNELDMPYRYVDGRYDYFERKIPHELKRGEEA